MDYVNCNLCPRRCGVDRTAGQRGFCGCPDTALVAKAMLHKWEEPVLAGAGGSGAVFFGGCTLRCRYCQNAAISGGAVGKATDSAGLRQLFEDLIARGAENIDLVTPTHFLPTILPALRPKLPVPVVYNCGGYERVETLRALEDRVDIYLPDLKYADGDLAGALSGAPDYFPVACDAIREMFRQTGRPVYDEDGIMQRGVIVRHLALPGHVADSRAVLQRLAALRAETGVEFIPSLMSQFTPFYKAAEHGLGRRITTYEYRQVIDEAVRLGLTDGYMQEKSSAREEYTPPFDLEGV